MYIYVYIYIYIHTHIYSVLFCEYLRNAQCSHHVFSFFVCFYFILFIYVFLVVLGLRCCAWAFSSCGERGPLFVAVHGPLIVMASLVAEHRLQACGPQQLWHAVSVVVACRL